MGRQHDLETRRDERRLIVDQRVAAVPAHPVVDVLARPLADLVAGLEEVGERQDSAWVQDPVDLGVAARLVGHKEQGVLADDVAEGGGLEWHLGRRSMPELDVPERGLTEFGLAVPGELDPLDAEVEPFAMATSVPGEVEEEVAAAAADVEHAGRAVDARLGRD